MTAAANAGIVAPSIGGPSLGDLQSVRRVALTVDLVAVFASLAANVAAAPASAGGWLIAAVAPLGLFLAILLWHRSHGVIVGWLAVVFNTGLAVVATGAAVVSFGHLQEVARRYGQPSPADVIIPLVIDATAVLATIVVVSAGKRAADMAAAELAAETAQAETEAAEAKAERVAADELAAEQARAEAETARLAAAKLETERAEAAEAVRRRERLATATAAPAIGTGSKGAAKRTNGAAKAPASVDTATLIGDYLAEHPEATQSEVAEALNVSGKTVQRSTAWKSHKADTTRTTAKELDHAS